MTGTTTIILNQMATHPWMTAIYIVAIVAIIAEGIRYFLGTGKIGDELEKIRKILEKLIK